MYIFRKRSGHMKSFDILNDLKFNDGHPVAESLLADKDTRLIRFSLLPGQHIKEHSSPSSTVCIIILKGRGLFSDERGDLKEYGVNTCLQYDRDENHSIQAVNEELVFLALLKGTPRKMI